MYTIGQFSKIGRISTRMLRYYDTLGLIKPSFINPENQYRYYEKHQVKDILKINKLRRYRFSSNQIKQIMEDSTNITLTILLSKQIHEIEFQIQSSKNILLELKDSLNKLEKGEDIMNSKRNFNISIDTLKDTRVLSLRDTILMDNIGNLIGKVFEAVSSNNLSIKGNIMTLYYDEDFDPNNADIEICIPVDRELKTPQISTRILKGGLYCHTTFIGPYSEIGESYREILDWIDKNSYKIIGAPHDEYIKGPESKCSPNEFITEVYFPIGKE